MHGIEDHTKIIQKVPPPSNFFEIVDKNALIFKNHWHSQKSWTKTREYYQNSGQKRVNFPKIVDKNANYSPSNSPKKTCYSHVSFVRYIRVIWPTHTIVSCHFKIFCRNYQVPLIIDNNTIFPYHPLVSIQ